MVKLTNREEELLMWAFAHVTGSDNIVGLHVCDNFRAWRDDIVQPIEPTPPTPNGLRLKLLVVSECLQEGKIDAAQVALDYALDMIHEIIHHSGWLRSDDQKVQVLDFY